MPATFAARLNDRRAGAVARLQVMRGDRLLILPVTLQEDRKSTYKVVEDPNAPAANGKSGLVSYGKEKLASRGRGRGKSRAR